MVCPRADTAAQVQQPLAQCSAARRRLERSAAPPAPQRCRCRSRSAPAAQSPAAASREERGIPRGAAPHRLRERATARRGSGQVRLRLHPCYRRCSVCLSTAAVL